jgi:hypothetical protein
MRFGSNRVEYQPLGVVGIISPWNYPVNLSLMPVVTDDLSSLRSDPFPALTRTRPTSKPFTISPSTNDSPKKP